MMTKFLLGAALVLAVAGSVRMQQGALDGLRQQGQNLMNQVPGLNGLTNNLPNMPNLPNINGQMPNLPNINGQMPNLNGLFNNGLLDTLRNLPTRTQELISRVFSGLRSMVPTLPGLGRGGSTVLDPLERTLNGGLGSAQNLMNQGTKTLTDTTGNLQGTLSNAIPSQASS